jgi:hypothetical protein
MTDIKKAGLLSGALVGAVATSAAAQEYPTQEGIASLVSSMMGNSGGSVSVGGSGTVASGLVTGGGDSNIGSSEGLAVADASGGNHNIAFVS